MWLKAKREGGKDVRKLKKTTTTTTTKKKTKKKQTNKNLPLLARSPILKCRSKVKPKPKIVKKKYN